MSSLPVQRGPWTDWSSEKQQLWTTDSSTATLWTNLIAFVLGTFVLGAVWNVIAFTLHRSGDNLAPNSRNDGLHRHHRLIWRNIADPLSAAIELATVGWAWLRTGIPSHEIRQTKMSRAWILGRTIGALVLPICLFASFTAASILAAKIALPGGNVRVKAHAKGKCGLLQYHYGDLLNQSIPPEVLLSYQSSVLRDTVAGRAYARSCYSQDFASTVSCSFFVKPRLKYIFYQQNKSSGCPFGGVGEPFETGPCNASRNEGAYVMYTPLLNSDLDLGINARPEHRVTFQKNTTCSVVNPIPYESPTKGFNTSPYNYTYQVYCLGPLGRNISGPCRLDTSTFLYNPAEVSFEVGYQTNSIVYLSNSSFNKWQAFPEFQRLNGDTTLVSISANSILYTNPVYDPLFLSTAPQNVGPGTGIVTAYAPFYYLNIMGCVDQYIICNPRFASKCTPPSGIADLGNNYDALGLNDHQTVTAFRITVILQNTNTYANTYATGDEALKASDKALYDLSLPLPDDQWITEVRGWFETGLAKMQAYAVRYAADTHDHGDVGGVKIPEVDNRLKKIFNDQCAAQKIKSSNEDQNLSLTGIVIVAAIGGVLWIVGLFFHPAILPLWRKHVRGHFVSASQQGQTKHQRDYMADCKYHLYFMAVEDRDKPYEYYLREECPTFIRNPELPNPGERAPSPVSGNTDKAIVYHYITPPPPVANIPAMGSHANAQGHQPQMSNAGQNVPMSSLPLIPPSGSQQSLLPAGHVPAGSTSGTSSYGSSPSAAIPLNADAAGATTNSNPSNSAATSTQTSNTTGTTAGSPATNSAAGATHSTNSAGTTTSSQAPSNTVTTMLDFNNQTTSVAVPAP